METKANPSGNPAGTNTKEPAMEPSKIVARFGENPDSTLPQRRKVRLNLVGLDGNAFALLGAFQRAARSQGWNQDEIRKVINDASAGDYNNLLQVLMEVTQ